MFRGKQVLIRPFEADDQRIVTEITNDPVVRGNVVGWDWPQSVHAQQQWFNQSTPGSTQRWVVESSDGQVIGVTGLWDIDWHNRNALTALKLGGQASSRGKGLGTDAIKAVMAFAFYDVGLRRLHTTILADNVASRRAYVDKCRWQVEGTLRSHVWRNGEFRDLLTVGILKEEFDALPDSREYVELVTTH